MDWLSIKEMIPLFIAGMTTLGGAIVWIFNRMDAKNIKEREFESAERAKLEKFFTDQISTLQTEVNAQNVELNHLRRELSVYVRHVGILEGLLKAKGVEPPPIVFPTF
jgi:hypothetical protein